MCSYIDQKNMFNLFSDVPVNVWIIAREVCRRTDEIPHVNCRIFFSDFAQTISESREISQVEARKWMEASWRLHALSAIPRELVFGTHWASEPILSLCRRGNSFSCRKSNPRTSSLWPVAVPTELSLLPDYEFRENSFNFSRVTSHGRLVGSVV
jgi:hypothetical protein